MKPKWFRLLEEQRYGRGLTSQGPAASPRLGLTVAFLVGALREPPGSELASEPTITELRDLLAPMMIPRSTSSVVRIYECGTLGEPTACLSDSSSGSSGDSVALPDGSPSALFAWPQYFSNDSRDLESLSGCLWGLLNDKIRRQTFSFRQGSYQQFNEDDREFIARALARHDDDA